MSDKDRPACFDCGVTPGSLHIDGCDIERCPNCGGQAISCDCSIRQRGSYPRLPWTGQWPGDAECREYGYYTDDGLEDLTRLMGMCDWNPKLGRWVKW